MPGDTGDETRAALDEHLAWWGLKRFTSDPEYFAWQRAHLAPHALHQLNEQAEQKRAGDRCDEIAFYDLSAQPHILPVLYSQRYDYYREIGSRVAFRIGEARSVLDFGCGVGILTTFYASRFPDRQFVGLDRSPASIAVAEHMAQKRGLANIRFECRDVEREPPAGLYDLVIATHALVQVEQDPGSPSRSWQTFERAHDPGQQALYELRTGIGVRLDRLNAVLVQTGRMIVFEKTRQLARRVPFQRALSGRGLRLIDAPEPIRYHLVEEVTDDGPFYVLQKGSGSVLEWDERPEPDEGPEWDRAALQGRPSDPDVPLFENHWPSAQRAWERLVDRTVLQESTRQEPDGRQLHIELGATEGLQYLYCANTYDQRQLVIADASRSGMLETYYHEILREGG